MLLFLPIAMATSGCIKEDRSHCLPGTVCFTVKAYTEAQAELTQAEVGDVLLYVFDGDFRFMELIETQLGTVVEVRPPASGGIHIVAWGNLKGGNQTLPLFLTNDHKQTGKVSLLPDSRAAAPHHSPNDLFLGEITTTKEQHNSNVVIPMFRKTGSMTVTVRKLKEYAGFADNNFSVVIRETSNTFDFYGNCTGAKATYRPNATFSGETFNVPVFNIIPETGLTIDLYHGNDLVYSASSSGGQPIDVTQGKLTNVLIDFTGSINVSVQETPWGQKYVWKEY